MSLITPVWQPPCDCEACRVAQVTERRRPFADCHGRELLKWWLEYERFQFAARRAMKTMGAGIVQTKPNGEPL